MKYIVIVLHGYTCKPAMYESVKKVVAGAWPGATVLIPALKMHTFSMADPDELVLDALRRLDAAWEEALSQHAEGAELPKIVIIGHSTGALLARKLFVVACGENDTAPFEKKYPRNMPPKPWASRVDRIILLAGLNRGWTLNEHLYTKTALLMRIGMFAGGFLQFLGYRPLVFKTRRGAPFVTQLRIQWLTMLKQAANKHLGNVTVIQLLGTKDDIIPPEDSVDMITGGNFIYLEVPDSDHMTVLKMTGNAAGAVRGTILHRALTASPEVLKDYQVQPTDPNYLKVDPDVTDVVFVVHGIRDTGYWTQKVARRVKAEGDKLEQRKFATETSTYGYFPMLSFLLSFARREKVEWFMDQYTENMSLYPNARFSFMGHSNGTYLLFRAMKEYPACRFKHVVFAGSVVPSSFNVKELIRQNRIGKFYNMVATNDWVVATFPKSFQSLRLQDIGGGGFDGFSDQLDEPYQLKFVPGSHGAATEEIYWDNIADFIIHGKFDDSINTMAVPERPLLMKWLGALAPFPFILLLLILIAIGTLIWFMSPSPHLTAALYVVYFFVLWKFVTQF
ncbi:MAG: alpha/beta hydrolase [Chitinophaga sp.]|uniref:alpha/beta fold hydrolase n=1 Tax=Chitinophaga sp. TaxID=1869181 RepID=UPI001B144C37|nr:alpha/beta hydrolase [Chitinophaga sp.]MBO9731485.1 alpha/beta hydrolase [Chitinophaga sp.]